MKLSKTQILGLWLLFALTAALGGCERIASLGAKHEREAEPAAVPPPTVQTAEVVPFDAGLKVEGVATILAPDALVQLDGDIKAAAIAWDFSKGQFERFKQTKSLAVQTVANAEKQVRTDEAQLRLLESRLVQAWGQNAPFVAADNRKGLMPELAAGAKVIVRLDFPQVSAAKPRNVLVVPLQGGAERPVTVMWDAPSGTQAMPGVSYLGLMEAAPGLRAGDRARVVAERAESAAGVIIPNAAIVIFESQAWCYVETAAKTYERRPVQLDHPVEDGYVVASGFPKGTRVVVRGASGLLAREAGPGELDDDDGGGEAKPRKAPDGAAPSKPKDDDDDAGGAKSSKAPDIAGQPSASKAGDAEPQAASQKDDAPAAAGKPKTSDDDDKPAPAGQTQDKDASAGKADHTGETGSLSSHAGKGKPAEPVDKD